MFWRVFRWTFASCIFLILIIAIYFSARPEEIIIPLDLEKSEVNINDLDHKILDGRKEVLIIYEGGVNSKIVDRKNLPDRKLFSLIDQAKVQEGGWGKELVVKTKIWWPFCIGAFLICLVGSVGIGQFLKSYIR